MNDFNPLTFIANHAGMNLADAIKEAYERGKMEAQPKTGKWIDVPHTFFTKCSACEWLNDIHDFDYCPNCGAKMKEGD